MALKYYLMRKNETLTLTEFDESGVMTKYSPNLRNYDAAPLAYRTDNKWLKRWWQERSVPLTRDQIEVFLRSNGYSGPEEYLISNLGLSLTDYYWIKPIDSDLTWETVNLFDNNFHKDMFLAPATSENEEIPRYSPNSSLQGDIEKTWTIVNGKRCLIKGNHGRYSSESINEVIASEIHKRQGYDNYTKYSLIKIKDKPYDYGCISEMFTSQNKELIPAWAICSCNKKNNNISYYEFFIEQCSQHGIDSEQLRSDLEYQIMTDFILSGYDRHLNNIGVLRDAETMQFIRMAPIFDSGGSLFANKRIPLNLKEMEKMEIIGFASKECTTLSYVTNPNIIDLTKLPPASFISDIYHKDTQIEDETIKKVVSWYEKKIDITRNFQLGKGLYRNKIYPAISAGETSDSLISKLNSKGVEGLQSFGGILSNSVAPNATNKISSKNINTPKRK